jgi:hypothetical protein
VFKVGSVGSETRNLKEEITKNIPEDSIEEEASAKKEVSLEEHSQVPDKDKSPKSLDSGGAKTRAEMSPTTAGNPRAMKALPSSPEEVIKTMRRLKEDVGQISELSSEEGNIVTAFSIAFLKLMEPLAKALPIDTSVLPLELGIIERANVLPKGELVVLYSDGRMESIDLAEAENRDLLVTVVSDAMPRFNRLISDRRTKIEKRIEFLSKVTQELQSIADSLAETG